jgi:sulfonate transport system ATP-binding protein
MNAVNDLLLPSKPRLQSVGVPDGLEISLRGVSKGFGDRGVLHDVDLQIAPGEFVAVVGRSGSGKSTLLRLLAGLDTPDAGTVLLGGKAPAAQGNAVRIMFQDGRLLPWRRVIDNVALGVPRADRGRAEAALAATGLADRAREWPRVLSGGQKQRVALARALATQPKLILLDEPLGALDALTRLEMQRLIENIWQQAGFTAVLVTHDVAEAALLADRVVLIEHGRIALDLRIDLPRPREPGEEMSRIERTVLHRILAG